jgi:hypothetical protein
MSTYPISGNGLTDIFTMRLSHYDMTCTPASVDPILDIRFVLPDVLLLVGAR